MRKIKGTGTKRSEQVDMSPEGIDRRMRDLAQIYRLGLEIAKARPAGKLRDLRDLKDRR